MPAFAGMTDEPKQNYKFYNTYMNYLHHYHAGNFADVFKHIMLVLLLQALHKKEKPFFYLDTHAGSGFYDLTAIPAGKTKEYQNGIQRIYDVKQAPSAVLDYLKIVHQLNAGQSINNLHYYPGSPYIARQCLRENDRMLLAEIHPEPQHILKNLFRGDKQVSIQAADGYQALKAFLPPKERRGLIFIDPPYESKEEFNDIYQAIYEGLQRWQTGIFAIWYPITQRQPIEPFCRNLKQLDVQSILQAEFFIYPKDSPMTMNGCGMIIINPPWQFAENLEIALQWLKQNVINKPNGHYGLQWLKEENR